MQRSKMYYFHLLVYAGLNPKLPDFMLPKKKKAVASAEKASDSHTEEPVAGTSTGGQTVQVCTCLAHVKHLPFTVTPARCI